MSRIIEDEMNKIGGLKVSMPVLATAGLWKKSGKIYFDKYFKFTVSLKSSANVFFYFLNHVLDNYPNCDL